MIEFGPRASCKLLFDEALLYCMTLDHEGYCNWRLPNSDETVFEVFELNSEELHGVLTIPCGIYYSLINTSEVPAILLNATDLPHNSDENLSLPLEYPEFASLIVEFGG